MAETLDAWIVRQLRDVTETGKSTRALRLTTGEEGRTWERFDSPLREEEGGPGAVKLAEMLEELIKGLADEWPAKRTVQVMVIAEDAEGLERAVYVKSVRGRSASASGSVLGGEAMHIAQAGQIQLEAIKQLVGLQMTQNASQAKRIEKQDEMIQFLVERMSEEKVERALEDVELRPDVGTQLAEQIAKQAGPVLEMIMANIAKGNA